MPTFLITSPEGKKFRVNAPEGATREQALQKIKEKYAAPSVTEDVAKSTGSGLVKYAMTAPLWAADTANAAAQGLTRLGGAAYEALGGELSVEQAEKLTNFKPFYGSEELVLDPLKKVGVDFYEPKTTAGKGADIITSIASPLAVQQALTNPKNAANLATKTTDLIKSLGKDQSGAVRSLVQAAPGQAKTAAQTIKDIPKEYKAVYDKLAKDFPDPVELQKQLARYFSKKDVALIQMGDKNLPLLGERVAQTPSGAAVAKDFFDTQVMKAPERLKTSLAKNISSKVQYYDTLDNVLQKGRKIASPTYQKAFKANQQVTSPMIERILQTPQGKSALSEAVKNMQNEMLNVAKPDKMLTQAAKELSDLGLADNVGQVAKGLKLQTLDYVKRGFDDAIRSTTDPSELRRLKNTRSLLVKELDTLDKSGLYAKARSQAGDYLQAKEAMEKGLDFLTDDVEVVQRFVKDLPNNIKDAYKVGVQKAIRVKLDNKVEKGGENISNVFRTPAVKQKLESLLGNKEYMKVINEAEAVDSIYKLRNQITGNSRTILRNALMNEADNVGQEVAMDLLQNGVTGTARKRFFGYVQEKFDGINEKTAEEVAKILTTTDPKKKFQIVKNLTELANKTKNPTIKARLENKLVLFHAMEDNLAKARKSLIFNEDALKIPATSTIQNQIEPAINSIKDAIQPDGGVNENTNPIRATGTPFSANEGVETMTPQLESTIRKAEGERMAVYDDATGRPLRPGAAVKGKRTIGIGFNMDSPNARNVWKNAGVQTSFDDALSGKAQITKAESDALLRTTMETAEKDARKLVPNFDKHPPNVQDALIEMSFQLGKPTLAQFKRTLNAIKKGEYELAARFLKQSKYATQTPSRVKRIAQTLTA